MKLKFSLCNQLEKLFFQEESPHGLAILRITVATSILLMARNVYFGLNFTQPVELFQPRGIFQILNSPFSDKSILAIFVLWVTNTLAVLLGFQTRYTTKSWYLLSLFVLGYPNNFGKVNHSSHMILMAIFVLAFSPCGDVYSIDASRKRKRPMRSWEYAWPKAFLRGFVVLSMFTLGLQKLVAGGTTYFVTDRLYLTLILGGVGGPLKEAIIDWPPIVFRLMAFWAVIVVELLAPLALFPPFRHIYPLIWATFHMGVTLVFGGHLMFWSQIPVYLTFFNFRR